MLALSRKPGEQVVIGGGITLTVLEVTKGRVRLAFDAPITSASCAPNSPAARVSLLTPTWTTGRVSQEQLQATGSWNRPAANSLRPQRAGNGQ